MQSLSFEPWQYAVGALCALIIGFSKTGVPGTGILMVPMMAWVFGGRLSVGATLPLLIFADCFAVAFYRSDAQWDRLRQLLPWVIVGLGLGTWFLKELGDHPRPHDPLNPIIGGIVLFMLALALLRSRLGERFAPHGKFGTRMTGVLGGFTTMVSNAAGPVMQIYLVSTGMPKQQLMGTTATYFFLINTAKVAPLIWLTLDNPSKPLFTMASLRFDLFMLPVILIGAYAGRKLLPYIRQKAFNNTVLVLSAAAAIKLLLS
ncbi:MAG: sulfite exporter TauE/SafE family protein [Fimbriimonas sp.]